MQTIDDFIAIDQFNLDEIRKNLAEFRDLMPLVHALYSRALEVVPLDGLPLFGQTLLICHKAFLCAVVTIGRRHPDDAAAITRRAIEAASLAVAVKADVGNFERWQDYERRSARWRARHAGEKPPRFKAPKIEYPQSLDRLRSHLGTLSDAYVHFTPEFAAGQEWRRNKRGDQAYAELPYITVDAETIARELFVMGSFHTEILELFDRSCFDGVFNRDADWRRIRKEEESCVRRIRAQPRRIENVVRDETADSREGA